MRHLVQALALFAGLATMAGAQSQRQLPEPIAQGMQLARQGQYQEAERLLKQFAEQNPQDSQAQRALGELYYHFGYYAAAEPVLGRAFAVEPRDKRARILSAVCLFKIGDIEHAVQSTKALLAETPPPNDIDLSLTYAQYLYENHDLNGALTLAKATVAFAPQHPIGFFWLARILQARGDTKEATKAAEQSVELAPSLPYARNLLVRLYRLQGRADDAEREAQWLKDFETQKANQ
jgi:tetratricopeptide (TPR) repeat protein